MNSPDSLSVVIPVYNDAEVLPELCRRLWAVLQQLGRPFEVVLVDDGSRDASVQVLKGLAQQYPHLLLIRLTRNFGQFNAISCGLDHAAGQTIVLMDSDLQDRPEDIPLLLQALEQPETDLAIARWTSRQDSARKQLSSRLFNSVVNAVAEVKHPPQLGVFRAMRRRVAEQLRQLPERSGNLFSLFYWAGFRYVAVPLERDARYAGSSSYSLRKMLVLAADVVFPNSLLPLRIIAFSGAALGSLGLLLLLFLLLKGLFSEEAVAGWAVVCALLLFLFGLLFCALGILGEYLGRVYREAQGRPKYLVGSIFKSGGNG